MLFYKICHFHIAALDLLQIGFYFVYVVHQKIIVVFFIMFFIEMARFRYHLSLKELEYIKAFLILIITFTRILLILLFSIFFLLLLLNKLLFHIRKHIIKRYPITSTLLSDLLKLQLLSNLLFSISFIKSD
jgi:hypothetical protein